ncbi:MAG: raffinose/stachyose/melibiose transport system permease protein [Thermomicrobiales bacterium]|jgi:ABC-type sugar transport system permease subunit|nr:raffinose/stachyose/melibiose transport system permease protein [Thermomicrobiales bacterium]
MKNAFDAGVTVARPARAGLLRLPALRIEARTNLIAYLSLLPAFALVAALMWYPLGVALYHSFTEWDGLNSSWVGLQNYRQIVKTGDLRLLLRNNLIFLLSIPGILAISLVVTVLLYEGVAGSRFFRSVYYLPTILSTVVVGFLMKSLFWSQGLVNSLFDTLGLGSGTRDWLGTANTAFMVLILAFYWQTLGQGVLIFLSTLANISTDILDAARLDGAGWSQRLVQIIVPLLRPAILYFSIVNVVWVFVGVFTLVYAVTGGGPAYQTTPMDFMIYLRAFQSDDLGYASALSVILLVIATGVAWAQLRIFDRMETE